MANEQRAPLSLNSAIDLTAAASYGLGVVMTSTGINLPSAGGTITGVLGNKPAIGKPGDVRSSFGDRVIIRAGGTIAVGDDLKVQADGTFITCVTGDVAAGKRMGVCTDASTIGNLGSMIFCPGSGSTATAAPEQVTTGALSANAARSLITIVGTKALTLPDGKYLGQTHDVEVIAASATPLATLTVTTPLTGEASTHLLKSAHILLKFVWQYDGTNTGWHLTSKGRSGKSTYVVGTGSLAGCCDANVDLSITGTVAIAFPDGGAVDEMVSISVSTAASTPVGTATGHFRTKAGVVATTIAGLDATTDYVNLMWDGATWQELSSTGVTYS